MKVATIAPIPDLHRFEQNDVHLVLAQLCSVNAGYAHYYAERARENHYIILDNGADELGEGMSMKYLLQWAKRLHANEVVFPDVQQHGGATYDHALEAAKWLLTPEGREAYAAADYPRFMIVPQGKTLEEWTISLHELINLRVHQAPIWSPNMPPVIGIAKNHDALIEGGITTLVTVLYSEYGDHWDVHLLGWPRRLESVWDAVMKFPRIRSIDTARPFVYGKHGIQIVPGDQYPEYPKRGSDYFTRAIRSWRYRTVASNINAFKIMARDTDDARLRTQ